MLLVRVVLLPDFCGYIMSKRLIISTDEVNRYGFRVLSAGARLDKYAKNPVLIFGHEWGNLPIGRLEDVQIENGQITALPIFDENDEFGLACKKKWENNFLFAASIYFDPVSTSSDPALILPGQSGETVTEWELLEVSMVTVPANSGAAVGMGLSYRSTKEVSKIKNPGMDYTKIAQALGLDPGVTEDVIVLKIQQITSENQKLATDRINALMLSGKASGMVNEANEQTWRALAAADYANTAQALSASKAPMSTIIPPSPTTPAPAQQTMLGMLSQGNPNPAPTNDPRAAWTFDEWSQKDPKGLSMMRKSEPDKYQQLAMAKYEAAQ